MKITGTHLAKYAGHLGAKSASDHAAAEKYRREQTEKREFGRVALSGVETVGTEVALGYAMGAAGGMPKVGPVTIDLAIAGLGMGLGAYGLMGGPRMIAKFAPDLFAVGLGGAGVWGHWQGIALGQQARKNAGKLTGAAMSADDQKKNNVEYRTITAGAPNGQQGAPFAQHQTAAR